MTQVIRENLLKVTSRCFLGNQLENNHYLSLSKGKLIDFTLCKFRNFTSIYNFIDFFLLLTS